MLLDIGQSTYTTILTNLQNLGADIIMPKTRLHRGMQIMWQDTARTIPVTATGQPIGSVKNLGSAGGYFEASGSTRPILGVNGAVYDGVDDRLSCATADIPSPYSIVVYGIFGVLTPDSSAFLAYTAVDQVTTGANARTHLNRTTEPAPSTNTLYRLRSGGLSPQLNQSTSGLGPVTIRRVGVFDGANSLDNVSGDLNFNNTGALTARDMQGGIMEGGANDGGFNETMESALLVRFPRALSAGEISQLPTISQVIN